MVSTATIMITHVQEGDKKRKQTMERAKANHWVPNQERFCDSETDGERLVDATPFYDPDPDDTRQREPLKYPTCDTPYSYFAATTPYAAECNAESGRFGIAGGTAATPLSRLCGGFLVDDTESFNIVIVCRRREDAPASSPTSIDSIPVFTFQAPSAGWQI
ncbi:hypothetical protein MD484_g8791, partial [Candolleomyces efflorescens]